MAKDDFGWLVNVVEEEPDFPELKVWLVVPGGLLFGTLVSEKTFSEYGRENQNKSGISLEEGMLRAEMKLHTAEMFDKYEAMISDEHLEACLIDVQIFSGGVAFRPKKVRVRITDVSAWGMGAPSDVIVRNPAGTVSAQSSE